MDIDEFDKTLLSYDALGLTEPKWCRIMVLARPEITLKGMEYLEENSLMKKSADIAKGIKDIVPDI